MNKERTIDTLTIESTVLACNFVNTIYAWRGINLNEYLKTYDDLLAWCVKLDISGDLDFEGLSASIKGDSEAAAATLEQIKEVRQGMYNLLSAIAADESHAIEVALQKLAPWMSRAASYQQLSYKNEQFVPVFIKNPGDFLAPLWPVLASLRTLLLTADPQRIKECPTCGWVFLDETKNGRRKWCSPIECGTQDKMRRYHANKKLTNLS